MRVTIDLMKKSTQIIDLSNVINPRVGDDDLLLPLHIVYGDNQTDMLGKDVEFISQDANNQNIYVAGTCSTDTPGDNLYMGDLTFRFPAGTFQADGTYNPDKTMFRIVDKETQKVISSVNVKITVMKNAIEFDFDPDKSSYNSRAETMLQDFHDKGQAMLDEITDLKNQAKSNVSGDTAATAEQAKEQASKNAGDIAGLQGEVVGARGRYADLPGREDAQDTAISQKETIVNANANYTALQQKDAQQDVAIAQKAGKFELEDKLARMKLTPEGFANLDDLKARYPNGNPNLNVTVNDGHLYIWYDNVWKDCGQYQTAGLDEKTLESIKNMFYQNNYAIAQNSNLVELLQSSDTQQNSRLDQIQLNQSNIESNIGGILGAGILQDYTLTDQNGNCITDGSGSELTIPMWLPKTDETLTKENMPADAKAVSDELDKRFTEDPDKYYFPTMYLYGDGITSLQSEKDSLTATDNIRYRFPKFGIVGILEKIKVQGSSTATLPKKNWTIILDNDVEIFPQYGPQRKYVLKANMTDFSQLRNIGSAKLWGLVRQDRVQSSDVLKISNDDYLATESGEHISGESDPVLSIGGNFGAVDGFPIAVCVNDKYWGLYTFNLPKDKGMAKMGGGNTAIVSANWAHFDKHTQLDGTDMCLEFSGRKDSSWVTTSINSLIDAIMATYSDQDSFDRAVVPLLDLDSAIDYYAYTVATDNTDGMTRNYLLQTFNGTKWYLVPYDLDLMFGRTAEFAEYLSPAGNGERARFDGITFENLTNESRLWYQLWKFHQKDIIARYKALATDALASANIGTLFTNLGLTIPLPLIEAEEKLWPDTTHSSTNNIAQIRWWCTERINYLNNVVANSN